LLVAKGFYGKEEHHFQKNTKRHHKILKLTTKNTENAQGTQRKIQSNKA
jgi:hypothetical protein